ncbi:hypothetical protein FC56_GL000230 [Lentilactobacillus senioris DSM 24302 = JCM 17472]|uniref:Uncharacterized protein n=1 Tax=Lentilactobacillus senioris DSM 24302 = JCM 17472 TaxID=1423802 RepID=A0A0R2CP66_9LACO|nr:hypothetical protein [Lentilactobacillus senioris]KRM93518.1 hypothetical protein FC56_GL000230 [Lentilactobacillus senioris DSM 24302 = JCM 17472]
MKFRNPILTGLAVMSFGMMVGASPATPASAKTYKSVPRSIRGYYISKRAHEALAISSKHVVEAWPLADAYQSTVTKVKNSGHKYSIRAYIMLGGRNYTTYKLSHYAHNRLASGGYSFQKVSKHTYSKFLNSWKYVRG